MKKRLIALIRSLPLVATALLIAPNFTQAHQIGGSGMLSGLVHPILGFDHLLAMIAVGVIAIQWGGKAIWKIPVSFVSLMIVGGLLAISGIQMPMVESGIALSVLMFGAVIAISKKVPVNGAMLTIGLFALFHGHAHGSEMPAIASPIYYSIGFILATTTLHLSGVLTGYYAKKTQFSLAMLRYAGAGMAMVGLSLFI